MSKNFNSTVCAVAALNLSIIDFDDESEVIIVLFPRK